MGKEIIKCDPFPFNMLLSTPTINLGPRAFWLICRRFFICRRPWDQQDYETPYCQSEEDGELLIRGACFVHQQSARPATALHIPPTVLTPPPPPPSSSDQSWTVPFTDTVKLRSITLRLGGGEGKMPDKLHIVRSRPSAPFSVPY